MTKRVVLVYPHIIKGWQPWPRVGIPMSLLCIATPVMNAGYDVRIIDQRSECYDMESLPFGFGTNSLFRTLWKNDLHDPMEWSL
jgi:hypothetical protein